MVITEAGEEVINYYGISEFPAKGYGERIFNVHDYRSGTDVARFDVRRENRPGEGYWFHFIIILGLIGLEEINRMAEIFGRKEPRRNGMAEFKTRQGANPNTGREKREHSSQTECKSP